MKIIKTENTVQYSEIADISEFLAEISSPDAPVIVLCAENLADLSETDMKILKNCSALTVIAGENLSAVPQKTLAGFDLRITKQPSPIVRNDVENNSEYAGSCGENAAYRCSAGGDISNFFFTVLCGDEPFHEQFKAYLDSLITDKDEFQLYALAACFRAARNGSADDVFEQESVQFYRLMQRKSKEASNDIQ